MVFCNEKGRNVIMAHRKIGQVYRYSDTGPNRYTYYILSQVDYLKVALIELGNGNRYENGVSVEKVNDINDVEWRKITGHERANLFTLVGSVDDYIREMYEKVYAKQMPMTLVDYQKHARKFAQYPTVTDKCVAVGNLVYPVMSLVGEAGELANVVKKLLRKYDQVAPSNQLQEEDKHEIALELGDVLWYCAAVAHELNATLEEVAVLNIAKLSVRYENNNGR